MVYVGDVGMGVRERRMMMWMGVPIARWIVRLVSMVMVLVMRVQVIVG